jgi:hypothetical protein
LSTNTRINKKLIGNTAKLNKYEKQYIRELSKISYNFINNTNYTDVKKKLSLAEFELIVNYIYKNYCDFDREVGCSMTLYDYCDGVFQEIYNHLEEGFTTNDIRSVLNELKYEDILSSFFLEKSILKRVGYESNQTGEVLNGSDI